VKSWISDRAFVYPHPFHRACVEAAAREGAWHGLARNERFPEAPGGAGAGRPLAGRTAMAAPSKGRKAPAAGRLLA
jgi:hypothetical protein